MLEQGDLPLNEETIDAFILKTKREEDQLRMELALADRDEEAKQTKLQDRLAKAKAEKARNEAVYEAEQRQAYERSQEKKRAKQEREDKQREVVKSNRQAMVRRAAERDALAAKNKQEEEEANRELARLEEQAAKREADRLARRSDDKNPLSLANFKTRLKKTQEVSDERKKAKAEMIAASEKINEDLKRIQEERDALEALQQAQIDQPAAELELRAAAETPKRGRPTAPRPRGITKAQREARDAERQAKLLELETEELKTREEQMIVDKEQLRMDAEQLNLDKERDKRITDNKEEIKRLVAERKVKASQLKAAKSIVSKQKGTESSPAIASARADTYRLDDELAADQAKADALKLQIEADVAEKKRRAEELKEDQKRRAEMIRTNLETKAERTRRRTASQETTQRALKGQANKDETIRRTRGISNELVRRDERNRRRSASQELTLLALSGKKKQEAEERARKAEADVEKIRQQTEAREAKKAKEQQEALDEADRETLLSISKKAKKPDITPSPMACIGKSFSAVKQAVKSLKGRRQEPQAAEESPATLLDVAIATASSRAKAEQNRLEREAREILARSKSPSLLSKAEADELKRRGEVSDISQAKPRTEMSYSEKRAAVIGIKNALDEIKQGIPYSQSLDKPLYAVIQDPTEARNAFRRLRLTPQEQINFGLTEDDVVPKKGRGLSAKPKTFVEFGRFKLNENMLEEGTLQVKTMNGSPVPAFSKKIAISDTLQEILLDLIETKKLRGVADLDDEERRLLETLIIKAGLAHGLGVKKVHQTDEDAKKVKRFDLVKGIYEAGNNSLEVIHELRSLILYFIKTKRLNRKEGIEALQELQ
jgi:hypothetical protein